MSLNEFELIERYFACSPVSRDDVVVGIGDDAAEVHVAEGGRVMVDIRTFVEGRDFKPGDDPRSLAREALSSALKALSAQGASPAWLTLSLTLSKVDEAWVQGFAEGLLQLAAHHRVQLIGGDTTRGPTAFTLHTHGLIMPSKD